MAGKGSLSETYSGVVASSKEDTAAKIQALIELIRQAKAAKRRQLLLKRR